MNIYGKQIIDWGKLEKVPYDQRQAKILAAISHGLKQVSNLPLAHTPAMQIAKLMGADPSLVRNAPPVVMMHDTTVELPDRGYEALFALVDMLNSTSKTFELGTASGGVTFFQQKPGEEAKLSKLPFVDFVNVSMLRFTGGFAILDDWLRFNELYKIDDLTTSTVSKWYGQKADLFYALIEAMGAGINQAYDTDDAKTINNAMAQILADMHTAKYEVNPQAGFYILCHTNHMFRILKALAASFQNANDNVNQIVYPIRGVIPTMKINAANGYYVCLPGLKNKRGEWENLNTRPAQRNELVLGADHVWTGAYNGAIGESKQWRRCALQ